MKPEVLCTRFQLLNCKVAIEFKDPLLSRQCEYIAVAAEQDFEDSVTLSYRVDGTGPYEIYEEGQLLACAPSPADVQYHIYRRIYRRVFERYVLAGWIGLHAALVCINGKRMLLLGNKGAGKTTLTSALLFAGHEVEGDEMVLLRDTIAMASPRRLHLKNGIENQVPELAPLLAQFPTAYAGTEVLRALDPTELGYKWVIRAGLIDHIIWIRPNHGEETALAPLSSLLILQHLIEGYLGWGEAKEQVFRYCAQISRPGGYELALGQPRDAIVQLESLADQGALFL